jgi:hypothetical protein
MVIQRTSRKRRGYEKRKKTGGNTKTRRTLKKVSKKQSGGANEDIRSIVLSLLSQQYIPFLPTTHVLNDSNLVRDYLSSIDGLHLLRIIGENDKFVNSNSINGIIEDIDAYSMNMIKQMGNIVHLPVFRPMLQNFKVNCAKMSQSGISSMKKLHSYILDCDDSMSAKHVDWFDVILGLKKFDDQFEVLVLQEIRDKKIIMDSDKIIYALKLVREDTDVREIFRKRLMNCAYKPQSIWNQMMGTVSWVSYSECAQCPSPDCVLYLDDNYKSFLRMRHKVLTVDKIRMLIYVDIRAHLFSKYISLEALRISGERKKYVKSLLNKVYKEDTNISNIGDFVRTPFQMIQGLFTGGAEEEGNVAELTPELEKGPEPVAEPVPVMDPELEKGPEPVAEPVPVMEPELEKGPEPVAGPVPVMDSELEKGPEPVAEPIAEPLFGEPTLEEHEEMLTATNPEQFSQDTKDMTETLDESPPTSNKIFFITYNGGIKDDNELSTASYELIDAFAQTCDIRNKDRLVIHRTRTGPISVCFELEVTKAYEFLDEASMDDIKKSLEKAILENTFEESMKIKTLESLKDVYYEGITQGGLSTKDFRNKRAIVTLKQTYPSSETDRDVFELNVTKKLVSALGNEVDSRRLHLESITELFEDPERVVVQFLVMDGFMGTQSSYDIVQEFLSKKDDSEFIEKHELKNIEHLEGCLLFDTEYSRPYESKYETFKADGLKSMGDMVDSNRVQNYGCDDIVEGIKNNVIKNAHSLSKQCEDPINKVLGISSPQMRT